MAISSGFPAPIASAALQLGDLIVAVEDGKQIVALVVEFEGDRFALVFDDPQNKAMAPYITHIQNLPGTVRRIDDEAQVQPLPEDGLGQPYEGFTKRGLLHVSDQGEVYVSATPRVGNGYDWWSLDKGAISRAIGSDVMRYERWQLARRASPDEPWQTILQMGV